MKKAYFSPEMEIEKFNVPATIYTNPSDPNLTTDPYDPDTELPF